jgi:hypothetical protein
VRPHRLQLGDDRDVRFALAHSRRLDRGSQPGDPRADYDYVVIRAVQTKGLLPEGEAARALNFGVRARKTYLEIERIR